MDANDRRSAVDIVREKSWVVDLEKKLAAAYPATLSEEEAKWRKPSIFKLPDFVRNHRPDVFTPQVVAIGPYHHHKSHLRPLEPHKERALHHFLRRAGRPLGVYVREMEKALETIQDSYIEVAEEWTEPDKFIRLMITDGCFMLEVMRMLDPNHLGLNYAAGDPFFGSHALEHKVPYLRRDMLLLENQLPILVLNKLVSVERGIQEKEAAEEISSLLVRFFVPHMKPFTSRDKYLHALDLYRRLKVGSYDPSSHKPAATNESFAVMRSATELREAGIRFQRREDTGLIEAVQFDAEKGILSLPYVTVDDTTEWEMLNMVALEHLHAQSGSEVSSYVVLMKALVDSGQDVQLLHRHRLLYNGLGSGQDLAQLFSSMSREVIVVQGGVFGGLQEQVESYCRKHRNAWRANLVHTYFRNPWSLVSLLAATFLIVLAALSTIFSILQWKNS